MSYRVGRRGFIAGVSSLVAAGCDKNDEKKPYYIKEFCEYRTYRRKNMTTADKLFKELPEKIPGRPSGKEILQQNELILDATKQGKVTYGWCPIKLSDRLTVYVMPDALKLGTGTEAIRFAINTKTQQDIADFIGGYLLTPKLVDEVWKRSVKLEPRPQKISASKFAIRQHHLNIERQIKESSEIISGWKDWCIDNRVFQRPTRAINYGWHVNTHSSSWNGIKLHRGVSSGKVIQPASIAHDIYHSDYSQLCRLIRQDAILDGKIIDLQDTMADEELSELISHEGMLQSLRHPCSSKKHTAERHIPDISRLGDKGTKVKAWQNYLIDKGFGAYLQPWGADGYHGKATELATTKWKNSVK